MKNCRGWIVSLALFVLMSIMPISALAELPSPPYTPLADPATVEEFSFYATGPGYFVRETETGLSDCEVYGRRWNFTVPWEDREAGTQALKAQLVKDGVRIVTERDGAIYADKRIEEDTLLYMRFSPNDEGYDCEMSREVTLKSEKAVRLSLSQEIPEAAFYTVHDGRRLQRMDVTAEGVDLECAASMRLKKGKMDRSIDLKRYMAELDGPLWEIQNMPQFPGRYLWVVSLREGEEADPVDISLHQGLPLPTLKEGDTLGGLLVKNVPYGSAGAIPEYDDQYDFPGFSETSQVGDVTPTGEALFWLPPGMWKVTVSPSPSASKGVDYLASHFIPVHPGRMTLVEWPKSLNEAFASGESGRLRILKTQADAASAKIDIGMIGADRTQVVPSVENLVVTESGQPGDVVSVKRIQTPADVVLLLDSSGSMKGQMKAALTATHRFVSGLPQNTRIRVIDFDTKPKRLTGTTPKAALAALKGVRANGATALYDSILEGLDLLPNADRPALVVFTDGVDANYNDTGPGSKATQEEVLEAVSSAGVPVFTIGFGKKSDVDTLSRVAEMSGGAYYTAGGKEDLDRVFERINKNLGSQFRITYQRPKSSAASNRPVMSIMVDNSGSMDSWPDECDGCDKRLEKTRQILRRFVEDLPEDFLIQVASFSGGVKVRQVLTSEKRAALRAVSLMEGETTTDILGSMRTALETLKAVPSNRRYLVYLADAALDVDDEEKAAFEAVLGKLKDARISCLFVGMVDEDGNGAFAHAAEKTGGRYAISTNFENVAATFEALSKEIRGAPRDDSRSILRVALTHRTADGENHIFSAAEEVAFPKKEQSGEIASPEQIVWRPGPPLRPYDPTLSGLVSGNDIMMKDVRVVKRLPLDLTVSNRAVEVHLREALSLSRLRGIDVPDSYRLFALTLSFKNILPAQKVAIYPDGSNHPAAWVGGNDKPVRYENRVPTYLIPDIQKHFFLRWNNERSFPVSEATWLAEAPLTLPGEEALAVEHEAPVEGTLIFLVPSAHMQQASLHLYDTNYGHIDAPISGTLKTRKDEVETLPTQAPVRLSGAFSFKVTGMKTTDRIDTVEAWEDTVFCILEGSFRSRLQAHIDIDPKERFRLRVPTKGGSLFFSLHEVTQRLPLGFYRPTLLTPGTENPVRLVFRIPQALVENVKNGEIVVDVRGGGVRVPLAGVTKEDALPGTADGKGEGVAVKILRTGIIEDVTDVGAHLLAVEVALKDEKDNHHTQIGELIVLKNKEFDPEKAALMENELDRLRREAATLPNRGLANFGQTTLRVVPGMLASVPSQEVLIFGLDEESVIPDGHTRRGVFFFELPEETEPDQWAVSSLVIPGLSVEVSPEPFEDAVLLTRRLYPEEDAGSNFWEPFEAAVRKLIADREAAGFQKPGYLDSKKVDIDETQEKGAHVAALSLTAAGKEAFMKIRTLAELKKRLSGIRFLPSGGYAAWQMRYAPEAVLTQGWGTESDFGLMAEVVLSRQGLGALRTECDLTDKGRQTLAKLAGIQACSKETLPALRYRDEKGRPRLLVAPFLKDASELKGLVIAKPGLVIEEDRADRASVTVKLLVKPKGKNRAQQLADASDALAGDDSDIQAMTLFNETYRMSELSLDALDIGFTKTVLGGGLAYQGVLDGPRGRVRSGPDYCVNAGDFEVIGEVIEISDGNDTLTRTRYLGKGIDITGVFHTLGVNCPDLPSAAVKGLSTMREKARQTVTGKPDALSALKWYTRGALVRFLSAQTRNENELAKTLGLIIGRTQKARTLMVTVEKAEGEAPATMHMDLIYPHNEIHHRPDETAEKAFYIMAGMSDARFEAAALGNEALGLFDIWDRCPEGTHFMALDDSNRDDFVTQLEEKKYPKSIVNRFSNLYNKIVLFPSNPAVIDDKPRWAWLEFDQTTFQTVAVIDTGENGALVQKYIGDIYAQSASFLVGALVGVDASLWAVAAYSLEMDDYKEILKAAKKFVKALGNNFGVGVKAGPVSAGVGVGGTPSVSVGRAVQFGLSPSGVSKSNNILGFGNGYKAGVEYYFSKAQ